MSSFTHTLQTPHTPPHTHITNKHHIFSNTKLAQSYTHTLQPSRTHNRNHHTHTVMRCVFSHHTHTVMHTHTHTVVHTHSDAMCVQSSHTPSHTHTHRKSRALILSLTHTVMQQKNSRMQCASFMRHLASRTHVCIHINWHMYEYGVATITPTMSRRDLWFNHAARTEMSAWGLHCVCVWLCVREVWNVWVYDCECMMFERYYVCLQRVCMWLCVCVIVCVCVVVCSIITRTQAYTHTIGLFCRFLLQKRPAKETYTHHRKPHALISSLTHTYHTHILQPTHTQSHTHTLQASILWLATISRLLKIIGLFCKRDLQKRPIVCKETYNFKEPTNRSHPIYKQT